MTIAQYSAGEKLQASKLNSGNNYLEGLILANARFLGYMDNPGTDIGVGTLYQKPIVANIGGKVVDVSSGVTLDASLLAVSSSGWYPRTVNSAGAVQLHNTERMDGLISQRPSGIGSDGTFETFVASHHGYFKDASTRYIGADWVDITSHEILYQVNFGPSRKERLENANGMCEVDEQGYAFQRTTPESIDTSGVTGSVFFAGTVHTWPVPFTSVPKWIDAGCWDVSPGNGWAGVNNVSLATSASIGLQGFGATSDTQIQIFGMGWGVPHYLG